MRFEIDIFEIMLPLPIDSRQSYSYVSNKRVYVFILFENHRSPFTFISIEGNYRASRCSTQGQIFDKKIHINLTFRACLLETHLRDTFTLHIFLHGKYESLNRAVPVVKWLSTKRSRFNSQINRECDDNALKAPLREPPYGTCKKD